MTGSDSWPALAGCATNVSLQQTGHLGPSSPLPLARASASLVSVALHQLVPEVTLVPGAGDGSGPERGCAPEESAGAGRGAVPPGLAPGINLG